MIVISEIHHIHWIIFYHVASYLVVLNNVTLYDSILFISYHLVLEGKGQGNVR